MCHMFRPVELCAKMLDYIKCATGSDLWNYVKNAGIYKMSHWSGPVELCEYFEKKLSFLNIKSATGPDLWNYVKECWNI